MAGWLYVDTVARNLATSPVLSDHLLETPLEITSEVFALAGEKIGEFAGDQRYFVSLESLPRHLIDAFLVAEDEDFFAHRGVSIKGILRAAYINLRAGHVVKGGSTITQQLARLYFLDASQTATRKAREAVLALAIERQLTKQRILELYLNKVFLGNSSYGVEAAARNYFRKSAAELNVAEAALLAGLPKAPTKYAPHRFFGRAKKRQRWVLERLATEGKISTESGERWLRHALNIAKGPLKNNKSAPYFIQRVETEMARKFEFGDLVKRGLKIHTSLDLRLQKAASHRFDAAVQRWRGEQKPGSDLQASFVVLERRTGSILAMQGGLSFADSQYNRAAVAKRPLGSLFMPVYYALAIERGFSLRSSLFEAGKMVPQINLAASPNPEDDTSIYEGLVRGSAVESSRLVAWLGVGTVAAFSERLGLALEHRDLTLAIGKVNATLIQAVAAVNALIEDGVYREPMLVTRVVNAEKNLMYEPQTTANRVVSAETAFIMRRVFSDAVGFRTGAGPAESEGGIAGSDAALLDGWYIGFNDRVTLGIWVGADRGKARISRSQAELAGKMAALWREISRVLPTTPAGKISETVPSGIAFERVKVAGDTTGALKTLPFRADKSLR